jgi:pimeloyl-ACP methyl ester carboxylesterase
MRTARSSALTGDAESRVVPSVTLMAMRSDLSPLLLERCGVRLAGLDFDGVGPAALFVHGLAGHAGEWAQTASWLRARCRVVALDVRGHGASQRRPDDVSLQARVDDVAFVIDRLGLAPAVVVGQSLGAQTATVVAGQRPDLVRALIVAEASPAPVPQDTVDEVMATLSRWPVPFASREDAVAFFGGPSLVAEAWADGLERRRDGCWPRFDVDVLERMLGAVAGRSLWSEWERVRCPTLVVRAGAGIIAAEDARAMVDRDAHTQLVEIEGAAHDVHLDQPNAWHKAVSAFLGESLSTATCA